MSGRGKGMEGKGCGGEYYFRGKGRDGKRRKGKGLVVVVVVVAGGMRLCTVHECY